MARSAAGRKGERGIEPRTGLLTLVHEKKGKSPERELQGINGLQLAVQCGTLIVVLGECTHFGFNVSGRIVEDQESGDDSCLPLGTLDDLSTVAELEDACDVVEFKARDAVFLHSVKHGMSRVGYARFGLVILIVVSSVIRENDVLSDLRIHRNDDGLTEVVGDSVQKEGVHEVFNVGNIIVARERCGGLDCATFGRVSDGDANDGEGLV